MIVAGIGSRKGVSAAEVIAAVDAALKEHGLERGQLAALATTAFKRGEAGIFEAGRMMGLEVVVVETLTKARLSSPPSGGEVSRASARDGEGDVSIRYPAVGSPPLRFASLTTSPPEGGEERSPSGTLSFAVAGVASVSEAAALAAAGEGARLAGPRIAVGPVTCAIAFGGGEP